MIIRVAIVIGLLLAVLLLFAATKPNTIHIQRSITINASPGKVFNLINDLHSWKDWDPQGREDPTLSRTYGGPSSGVGAFSDWEGHGNTGKGRMMIVESLPNRNVTIKVDFIKPFQSENMNEFSLEPVGDATKVTWTWNGTNVYFMKVMSVFVNMDKMLGKHFEDGLANLKTTAEN